jgi:hypothetical protein
MFVSSFLIHFFVYSNNVSQCSLESFSFFSSCLTTLGASMAAKGADGGAAVVVGVAAAEFCRSISVLKRKRN